MNPCLLSVRMFIAACFAVVAAQQSALAATNQSSCNSGAVFAVGNGYNVQNNGFNLQAPRVEPDVVSDVPVAVRRWGYVPTGG